MSQNPAPDYDRSGQFPIDEDGWQVARLGRMLYPGGPHGLRIIAPGYPPFHAGWRYAQASGGPDNRIVISHIGAQPGRSKLPPVHFTPVMLVRVQERLRLYLMLHAERLFRQHITGVDFVAEDAQVEIF